MILTRRTVSRRDHANLNSQRRSRYSLHSNALHHDLHRPGHADCSGEDLVALLRHLLDHELRVHRYLLLLLSGDKGQDAGGDERGLWR